MNKVYIKIALDQFITEFKEYNIIELKIKALSDSIIIFCHTENREYSICKEYCKTNLDFYMQSEFLKKINFKIKQNEK
jgi:hypothetical protein